MKGYVIVALSLLAILNIAGAFFPVDWRYVAAIAIIGCGVAIALSREAFVPAPAYAGRPDQVAVLAAQRSRP